LIRANDVTCGVDESTLSVIDTTIGTNECTFSANEQQKVYHQRPSWNRHHLYHQLYFVSDLRFKSLLVCSFAFLYYTISLGLIRKFIRPGRTQ
jgi:hypothetical protein